MTVKLGTVYLRPRASIGLIEPSEFDWIEAQECCSAGSDSKSTLTFKLHLMGGGSLASAWVLYNQIQHQLDLACSQEVTLYRRIRNEIATEFMITGGTLRMIDPINQTFCEADLTVEMTVTITSISGRRVDPYIISVGIVTPVVNLVKTTTPDPLHIVVTLPDTPTGLRTFPSPLHISKTIPLPALGQGQPSFVITVTIPSIQPDIGGDPLAGVINEFHWPPPLRASDVIDLDAAAQWWRKIGTPSTAPTYTTAGVEGIATTYGEEIIKCVAAAGGDGLKSTWTYADEKRVKSGRYFAIMIGVYIATAGKTVTASLVSSTPTTIATATTNAVGTWVTLALEPAGATLDGASVDVKVTLDGVGTFYVVPLGAFITNVSSPTAVALAPRSLVFKWSDPVNLVNNDGANDPNTWTDVDLTATTSALAVLAQLNLEIFDTTDTYRYFIRRNGSSDGATAEDPNQFVASNQTGAVEHSSPVVVLDDSQIVEYNLDRTGGAGTLAVGRINLAGWWEWE